MTSSLTPGSRVLPAVLAAVAWFAVLLQLWLSIQLASANGKTLAHGLIAYFGYFTVLTNIFVALVGTAGALRTRSDVPWLYRASVVGCATASIVVVGLAYHFLLRKIWAPQGAQLLADNLLHYVVPVLSVLHWMLCRHEQRLPAWAPIAWCAYPLAYLAYALVRGELIGAYPYPFIDVLAIGYRQALINALGLLAAFMALGYVVWGIALLARARKS